MGKKCSTLESLVLKSFWADKIVLITGHTGFKGSWLALWLHHLGAKVIGFALEPGTTPSLFAQLQLGSKITSHIGDITDAATVSRLIAEQKPEFVFHLAAQSLVLRSYNQTLNTWSTNVMGMANLLEALRQTGAPCTVVGVTTDKVYHNLETRHAYAETDRLGGIDPYSASKSGTELVIDSYRSIFAQEELPILIASARAGNVIGGGDWCENRLLPDIARALSQGQSVKTRNPNAVRPWQHVLEPLFGYMMLAERLNSDAGLAQAFNFGPNPQDNRTVEDVIRTALKTWPGSYHAQPSENAPHEAGLLMLSINKAKNVLGWEPRWTFETAVKKTVSWYKAAEEGQDPLVLSLGQIKTYSNQ